MARISTVNIKFSPKEIAEFADYLDRMPTFIGSNVHRVMEEAVENAAEVAKQNVPSDSGLLESSIRPFSIGSTLFGVIADEWYAQYVEYGTGIVAAQEGIHNPLEPRYWEFDEMSHGESGWYFHKFSEKYGKVIKKHTLGQPPSMFMYSAYEYLKDNMRYDLADAIGEALENNIPRYRRVRVPNPNNKSGYGYRYVPR